MWSESPQPETRHPTNGVSRFLARRLRVNVDRNTIGSLPKVILEKQFSLPQKDRLTVP